MARPIVGRNLPHLATLAQISMAGVRILANGTATPGTGAADSYTVTEPDMHRLLIFHDSGANEDIRVAVGAVATATDFPIASGVYFVLEVEQGEVISFFNTSGAPITIHVAETR